MSGAILPLPITPSWRGAQWKHRDTFTLTLNFVLWEVWTRKFYSHGDRRTGGV